MDEVMMSDDYGYFGSGSEGYAHYAAASGEDQDKKSSGGGGNKGGRKPGCGVIALVLIILYALFQMAADL